MKIRIATVLACAGVLATLAACKTVRVDPMAACLPGVNPQKIGVTVTRFVYQSKETGFSLEGCFPVVNGTSGTGMIRLISADKRTLREQQVAAPSGRSVEWKEDRVVYRSEGVRVEWLLPEEKAQKSSVAKPVKPPKEPIKKTEKEATKPSR